MIHKVHVVRVKPGALPALQGERHMANVSRDPDTGGWFGDLYDEWGQLLDTVYLGMCPDSATRWLCANTEPL